MKTNQLAIPKGYGLVRIEEIVSDTCIYCRILTGDMKGGFTNLYRTHLDVIPETENLTVY